MYEDFHHYNIVFKKENNLYYENNFLLISIYIKDFL